MHERNIYQYLWVRGDSCWNGADAAAGIQNVQNQESRGHILGHANSIFSELRALAGIWRFARIPATNNYQQCRLLDFNRSSYSQSKILLNTPVSEIPT